MSQDKAQYLASLVRGLEQLDREKNGYMTEWKHRREKLESALAAASDDVLSGQLSLPVEPAPSEPVPGADLPLTQPTAPDAKTVG